MSVDNNDNSQSPSVRLRTIVVDDEPLALDLLKSYLSNMPSIEIIAQCQNGTQAVEAIIEHQPDLVFLDIEMPGLNGLDVIKKLQADIVPLVVFVTAYDEYALNAFDVCAVDYILKPIDSDSLQRAVERSLERYKGSQGNADDKRVIVDAMAKMNESQPEKNNSVSLESTARNSQIVVKDQGVVTLIEQQDIEWIDAAGDYMCIHAAGETHIMRSTLKNLLQQLDSEVFKRVHRSTVVNLSCIEKIFPRAKGEYFLKLRGCEQVKVSRNYRAAIKEFLAHFQTGQKQ